MLSQKQLKQLATRANTNQTTVVREYLQLLFLSVFYQYSQTKKVYFKGGTAIRLVFGGKRFSEDLDFTVNLTEEEFEELFNKVSLELEKSYPLSFKEKDSMQGRNYLITAQPKALDYQIFVNLDFSFREKVLEPEKTIIKTDFPVVFTDYLFHLSKDEILAEKIGAVYTREKGRDLYDIWYLLNINAEIRPKLINKKLEYYQEKDDFSLSTLLAEIKDFEKESFVKDLRPFVIAKQRDKLPKMYDFILEYLESELK